LIANSLYIEINNYCNLNCIFCYNESGISKKFIELSPSFFEKKINKFKKIGIYNIIISGGEPFLHSRIEKFINIMKRYSFIEWHIVTNGTVIKLNVLKKIKECKNVILHVSLNGSKEIIDCCIRGEGVFNKTIKFINLLNSLGIRYFVKSVLTKKNYLDATKFYDLVVSMGGVPNFTFAFKQGNASNVWDELVLNNDEKLFVYKEILKKDSEHHFKNTLPICLNDCPLVDEETQIALYINIFGDIFPCQLISDNDFKIGTLKSFDEQKIKINILEIKHRLKERLNIDYGCKDCFLKINCKKGCLAKAIAEKANYLASDDCCNLRRRQFLQLLLEGK